MKKLKRYFGIFITVFLLISGTNGSISNASGTLAYNDMTYINDTLVTYNGGWQYRNSRGVGDYANDVHATIYNNDYFEYSFAGTGIDLITEKDSCLGNVDIYIDNVFQATVNCYNATLISKQTMYSKTGLAQGTHTIKGVKKSGVYMIVDALRIHPTSSVYVNDTLTTLAVYNITYRNSANTSIGSWLSHRNRGVGDFHDDVFAATANGDYFTCTFEGTGVDFITEKDSCLGEVDIYIDNIYQTTVNCYNPELLSSQTVFSKTGLTPGTHTIKGVKKNGMYMIVDALKVYYDAASIFDDYNGNIIYSGVFSSTTSIANCLNSSIHWTTTAGSYAELTFTGKSIKYIGSKNTDHGYVDIYIDDIYESTVDTYGSSRQWQYVFFQKTWSESGTHKIKVVCKNQKNANSTSIGFDLDAFNYTYDPEDIAMKPLWQGNTMYNESLLLVSSGGGAAQAPLLFTPTKILSVRNARLDIEYIENVDWTYANGVLMRTSNSRIPYLTNSDLYPVNYSQYATAKTGGGYILYHEDSFWHDRQIVVTYTHAPGAWTGPIPAFAGSNLPNTMNLLNNQSNMKLVVYGDSISCGANSSYFFRVTPYLPAWGELVASELEKAYGSSVSLVNASYGGLNSVWGKDAAANLAANENPDLVILAFGMNDGTTFYNNLPYQDGNIQPAPFKNNIASIIDSVRAVKPQAEFILVGTTLANPEAAGFANLQPQYISVLDQLASEKTGVVTANMTGVHQKLLQTKYFRDMTGNNVNHPNDFLSRWYAQFISGILIQP